MIREPAAWSATAESVVFDTPERLTDVVSWHTHIPFAFWCVESLRPRVLVELGTHKGDSYSAFCQAVVRTGLATRCYAVDTWQGDHEAGFYGDEVLLDLQHHHDARYASFSRLVRTTFDDAVTHFADGSVDLLHVDGLHTYEAVRHDFEAWLPKLSAAAVVLFHDVAVREADFGAWRFWEEVSARYPSFTFHHGHGLGVLLVGPEAPAPARWLAALDEARALRVRSFFASLGEAISRLDRERELGGRLGRAEAELSQCAARTQALAASVAAREGELAAAREELSRRQEALAREASAVQALAQERDSLEAELQRRGASLARLLASGKRLPRRIGHGAGVFLEILYWTATFQLRAGLRRRKYARIIRRSGLFDAAHYLSQCRGDAAARKDPIRHYLARGAAQGLDPAPWFDTSAYAEAHPASAARGKNPFVQFIRAGGAAVSGPARPVVLAGEALLARDPFRAPPPDGARRVLVVDHRLLTPDQDSGSVRMLGIVTLLREAGLEVTFVSHDGARDQRYEDLLGRLGVTMVHGFQAATAHLSAEGHRYGWALLSRPEQALRYQPVVRAYAPYAAVLYDTVDLHWVRMEREAEVTGAPAAVHRAQQMKRTETTAAACSDAVVTVTEPEKETLVAEVPGARVVVVPNVHDVKATCPPWEGRKDLMFIGGFEHTPNVDAVLWLVERILPLVHEELPGVVLHVVGSKAPEAVTRLASPAVNVAGWVPDVDEYFARSRVFVAPLRYGAGLKGKIGQSMSQGLPVVTTTIGAEGMGLEDGQDALVADAPEAFAAAIVRLYNDRLLWTRLSAAGMKHVRARYAPEVVRRSVDELLGLGRADGAVSARAGSAA